MRTGARLAVDVGAVRIGVAASDPAGSLALPVAVVKRDRRAGSDLIEIVRLASEREVIEIVVGWPRSLNGAEGKAAGLARDFADRLAPMAGRPVRLVDERLSTVEATRRLQSAGHDARSGRKVIDSEAAAVILETALDAERRTGLPPGELIEPAGQQ